MSEGTLDEKPAPAVTTPYEIIGGADALRRLVDRFYDIMETEPAAAGIRAMHGADLGPVRAHLFDFLSGWLGGPRLYSGCIMGAHRPFAIGAAERDQWLLCMKCALADTDLEPTMREALENALSKLADFIRNR